MINLFKSKEEKLQIRLENNLGDKLENIGEVFPIDDNIKNSIDQLKKEQHMHLETSFKIASNDMMFWIALHKVPLKQAYKSYLNTGWNARNIIKKIADRHFNNIKNVGCILDFASGFGRLTRHLIHDFPKEKIWISDIKKDACKWQASNFGVNPIPSYDDPNDFEIEVKFDIIFVGSLFSHLPEKLFKKWFEVLYNSLSDIGVFIFSALDISKHGINKKLDFEYVNTSEDKLISFTGSQLAHSNNYGMSYISKKYVPTLVQQLQMDQGKMDRYPDAFGRAQDIYVIYKSAPVNETKIEFNNYP